MKKILTAVTLAVAFVGTAVAQNPIQRVLLVSIDGMHAVDFLNCANGIPTINNGKPYCPALAALGKIGVNYVAATTSKPSDSFPGLEAIINGGKPGADWCLLRRRLRQEPLRARKNHR